jgi:ABC-type nitrate/sulfonate/bicarbonate transport system substrate-binding protein
MTIDRRRFLKSAVAGATLLAAPAGFGQAKRAVTTAFAWINNVQHAGYWIALERGYFAAEGLDAKHLQGGPNAPSPLATVAAGKADIGQANWLPFLDAVKQGNDFVIIGSNFPVSPLAVLSRADKPIRTAKDLVGAKILAQGPNERTAIEATLALNKLPNQYQFIPAGFSPEPLLARQGDAYTCFVTNQPLTLERMGLKAGKDFHVVTFDEMGFKAAATLVFVPRATLQRDRTMLAGYLRALVRGWLENEKDPVLAAKLVITKYGADLGLDLKQQVRQNETQIPLAKASKRGLFMLDQDRIEGMFAAARATGRSGLPAASQIFDLSVIEEAYKGIKA